eukprot:GHVP01068427.1.p1 GENE.GHVP01068427.1~~GHVP01068427.1.p1  ORF type:complete len:222 (+),score=40.13 GHVP01068427.1:201-866(+)
MAEFFESRCGAFRIHSLINRSVFFRMRRESSQPLQVFKNFEEPEPEQHFFHTANSVLSTSNPMVIPYPIMGPSMNPYGTFSYNPIIVPGGFSSQFPVPWTAENFTSVMHEDGNSQGFFKWILNAFSCCRSTETPIENEFVPMYYNNRPPTMPILPQTTTTKLDATIASEGTTCADSSPEKVNSLPRPTEETKSKKVKSNKKKKTKQVRLSEMAYNSHYCNN